MSAAQPTYLRPYVAAARRHGGTFRSLLWESRAAQKARFHALARVCDFEGRSILDVGCGRADLLDYLLSRRIRPSHYTGLEAVESLANAARLKKRADSKIIRADFIADSRAMGVGADILVFSGSLTMLGSGAFFATLRKAYRAAGREVAFNFLASPLLAGEAYLHWHRPMVVRRFAEALGGEVVMLQDYLEGDCTVRVRKKCD